MNTKEAYAAEFHKGLWQANRRDRRDFFSRNRMRACAHSYAFVRGWGVALTPPQRKKVSL